MSKGKINITLDNDLIDFIKQYAETERTSILEIFTQFVLNLKRTKQDEPTEVVLTAPAFRESLLETISNIRKGQVKWYKYDEVFK